MDKMNRNTNNLRSEFQEYVYSCVLSRRPVNKTEVTIGRSAAESYLSFVEVDKLFSYDPTRWEHIKSIFEIDSSKEIMEIFRELMNDETFVKVDGEGTSQYFRSNALKLYYCFLKAREIFNKYNKDGTSNTNNSCKTNCLQQIYYGAPGTGKSHTVNEITSVLPKEDVFRTTFHPDSDYSTFVGCYKPTMKSIVKTVIIGQDEKEVKPLAGGTNSVDQIAYAFVPQVFAKAYVRAYQTENPVFLVIEEINRGNCAQIFGDIFQLLDRDDSGDSKYAVKPDSDLENYLVEKLGDKYDSEEGMRLPSNLHIWATMNTSDQSLFPIDSAFKRRWDWQYIPIENHSDKNWKIKVGVEEYDWWEFLEAMNKRIYKATDSEDKQMGYFFVKLKNGETIISEDMIVNKVLFYLFNDVFKDYDSEGLFKVNNKVMCFSDYTKKNDRLMLLMSLMKSLNLESENEKKGNNAVNATPTQTTLDL